MRPTFRLGSIRGIEIGVHYTWIFAFILVSWSLASDFYPRVFEWSRLADWIAGVSSAVLLFGSVLLHELAHSFVAQAKGLPIKGITLFIFGGVSNLGAQAQKAGDEFAVAVVGPLTSLVLAGVLHLAYVALQPPRLADASLLVGILFYLRWINLLLGLFNMVPGFPLDGGRVLRALVWGATGSFERATNIAAGVGQVVGWGLIAGGLLMILTGELFGGMWMAFIGWFLSSAAGASRREVAAERVFSTVRVSDAMDTEPELVEPEMTLAVLVQERFLRRGRRAAAVLDGERLAGIVTLVDVRRVPSDAWGWTQVHRQMTRPPLVTVRPEDGLNDAVKLMAEKDVSQLLVAADGVVMGMLGRDDVMRYLKLSSEMRRGKPRSGPFRPGT